MARELINKNELFRETVKSSVKCKSNFHTGELYKELDSKITEKLSKVCLMPEGSYLSNNQQLCLWRSYVKGTYRHSKKGDPHEDQWHYFISYNMDVPANVQQSEKLPPWHIGCNLYYFIMHFSSLLQFFWLKKKTTLHVLGETGKHISLSVSLWMQL